MTPFLQHSTFTCFKTGLRLLACIIFFTSVNGISKSYGQSCQTIPSHFSSYQEAIATIKKSKFKVSEDVNTSTSTFIQEAHYYSCDGKKGYFIIKIKKREYVYENMPIAVWTGFKNSSSFGTFYNLNIRNKYTMYVN